ncbi:hypothetical protein P7K49_002827 [Saguinus oedipus]|uniref:Uncharacterized protein n=1 Tax=Saguinus oedipus TaxID=9490 RepID=A0ABQ9WIH7_SAGOE|nr:hypothetical protein P7K49_002827 [Saguinus oedipus]
MASSILEWVVSHQSCGRSKPRAQTEEAENSELSSSTRVWGVGQGPGSAGPPELGSSTGALLPPGHGQSRGSEQLGPDTATPQTLSILTANGFPHLTVGPNAKVAQFVKHLAVNTALGHPSITPRGGQDCLLVGVHTPCAYVWVSDAENAEAKLRGLPGQLVDIACKVCQTYLGKLEHEDIDMAEGTTEDLTEAE